MIDDYWITRKEILNLEESGYFGLGTTSSYDVGSLIRPNSLWRSDFEPRVVDVAGCYRSEAV